MRYVTKPEEVDAIVLTGETTLDGTTGQAGDYLVCRKGKTAIVGKDQFEMFYQPGETACASMQLVFSGAEMGTKIMLPPTVEEIARIKAENEQEDLLACFTCHRDVKVTEVDEEKNCPQCSTAPKGTAGKKTGIGVCDECGTPSFYEEMKEGVCKACQGVA